MLSKYLRDFSTAYFKNYVGEEYTSTLPLICSLIGRVCNMPCKELCKVQTGNDNKGTLPLERARKLCLKCLYQHMSS